MFIIFFLSLSLFNWMKKIVFDIDFKRFNPVGNVIASFASIQSALPIPSRF